MLTLINLRQCIIHCRQSFPFISIDTYVWVQQIALHSISSHQYTYLTFRRIFSRVGPQLQTRRNSKSTNKLRTIRDTATLESTITQRLTCYVSLDPCVGHWTPQKIKPWVRQERDSGSWNEYHPFALRLYKPIIFLQHRTIRVALTRIHFHALERTGLITTRQENDAKWKKWRGNRVEVTANKHLLAQNSPRLDISQTFCYETHSAWE